MAGSIRYIILFTLTTGLVLFQNCAREMDMDAFQYGANNNSSTIPLPEEQVLEPIMTLQAPEDITVNYSNVPLGANPSNQSHASMDIVIFSVETTGENNTYQWQYFDAEAGSTGSGLFVDIEEANTSILELRLSEYTYPAPLGTYRVVVTNEASDSQVIEVASLFYEVQYSQSLSDEERQRIEQERQLFYDSFYCQSGNDRFSSTEGCHIP